MTTPGHNEHPALPDELEYKVAEAQGGTPAALLRCAVEGSHAWLVDGAVKKRCARCPTHAIWEAPGEWRYLWPEIDEVLQVDLQRVHPRLRGESWEAWLRAIEGNQDERDLALTAQREGITMNVARAAATLRAAFPDAADVELAELSRDLEIYLRSRPDVS